MNIAIILSGGTGTRLGADIPKQYIEVQGRPLIAYCLEKIEQHSLIDAIQIVADGAWQDRIRPWCGDKFRGFSAPGANRQMSIYHALVDIQKYAAPSDRVLIHDAARPLVTQTLVTDCLTACDEHDGAIPVLPMKDTVYLGDGERITQLLERSHVYAGQAPEAFVLGKYEAANRQLLPEKILEINGSTEPAIMAGLDIALVQGDERNFKITTREDLERFEGMIQSEGIQSA